MRLSKFSRAFTLIEILVALAGLVFVMGSSLLVYTETQSAAKKMTTRQAATDYALLAMHEIGELIGDAVRPEDVDRDVSGVSFARRQLSFPRYIRGQRGAIQLTTLAPPQSGEPGVYYEIRDSQPAKSDEMKTKARTGRARPLIERVEDFEPRLFFRYALDVQPGKPIEYQDDLAEGEWPRLIEVTIEISLDDFPNTPVKLTTAFIPGRI